MNQAIPVTEVHIDDISHDGRGVGRYQGKVIFVSGALPGETVAVNIQRRKRGHDEAVLQAVVQASPDRVTPGCPHFQLCGGCALQHLSAERQILFKEKVLLDNLERIGKVTPSDLLAPVSGPHFGYRRRARLGVKYVVKKEKVLIGFREKSQSRYLADLDLCMTLDGSVGQHLPDIAALITNLDCYRQVPQVEVTIADHDVAMVLRHLVPLQGNDETLIKAFSQQFGWQVFGQGGGPDSVVPLYPEAPRPLRYYLDSYDIVMEFQPLDFIQVNATLNKKLIDLAVEWLDIRAGDNVLDLFCGIGNFTLPIATRAGRVVGIEGEANLVARAHGNAQRNGIQQVAFETMDLREQQSYPSYDKVLLDPPRSGAQETLASLAQCGARRIVYVSCNPATLARDAGILVNALGYRLRSAGVLDMFPHTAHVESIAIFEK